MQKAEKKIISLYVGSYTWYIVLFLALVCLMWFVGHSNSRFDTQDVVLHAQEFPGEPESWNKRGLLEQYNMLPDRVIVQRGKYIEVEERKVKRETFVFKRFDVSLFSSSTSAKLLYIRGKISVIKPHDSEDVPLDRSREAGYMVWYYDANDNPIRYLTVKALPARIVEEVHVDRKYYMPGKVASIALVMFLRDSNAVLSLDDAHVETVVETQVFVYAKYILFLAYGFLILLGLYRLLRNSSLVIVVGSVSLVAVIVVATMIPKNIRNHYTGGLQGFLESFVYLSNLGLDGRILLFKGGHLVAFFVLTVWLILLGKKAGLHVFFLLMALLLFALSTEAMQLFRLDRESRFSDLLIDMIGIGLGLCFIFMFLRLSSLKKRYFPSIRLNSPDAH